MDTISALTVTTGPAKILGLLSRPTEQAFRVGDNISAF